MSKHLPLQDMIYLWLIAEQVTSLRQQKSRVLGTKFHLILSQIFFLPPPHH